MRIESWNGRSPHVADVKQVLSQQLKCNAADLTDSSKMKFHAERFRFKLEAELQCEFWEWRAPGL